MGPDIFLTLGVLLLVPTIPMVLNGLKEGEAPRFALIMIVLSLGLFVTGFALKPGGYALNEIPGVVIDTITGIF